MPGLLSCNSLDTAEQALPLVGCRGNFHHLKAGCISPYDSKLLAQIY